MQRYKSIFVLAVFIGLSMAFSTTSSAYQPRIIKGDKVTEIENYEVSQAFYGNLDGKPDYYKIVADEPFKLYVGILVPDLPDIGKDVSVDVIKEGEGVLAGSVDNEFVSLDGTAFKWASWREEFAGDDYFKGPEVIKDAEAGTYNIVVSSPDNQGKYSLVVGEKESFPIDEILKTYRDLPTLKKDFFEKSPWTAYFNLVGLFALIFIVIIASVIWLVVWLVKRKRKKEDEAVIVDKDKKNDDGSAGSAGTSGTKTGEGGSIFEAATKIQKDKMMSGDREEAKNNEEPPKQRPKIV